MFLCGEKYGHIVFSNLTAHHQNQLGFFLQNTDVSISSRQQWPHHQSRDLYISQAHLAILTQLCKYHVVRVWQGHKQ